MPKSAPLRLVEFSRSALISNLQSILLSSPGFVVDLRCDAYGHGDEWVEENARELGLTAFLTNDDRLAPIPPGTATLYGIGAGKRVAVVSAEIVATKHISVGETVSYGNTWTAARPTRLALVSLGFADGLPRAGSNVASMSIAGQRAPVVGRIAMDQTVLDITDIDASVGMTAHVWNSTESISEWSSASLRDPLSLVAGLSWRVERSWLA